MPSFTHRIPALQSRGPIIEIQLSPSLPFIETMNIQISEIKTINVMAMIDTGASVTAIQQGLLKNLGINPIGSSLIHTPSSQNVRCNKYDVQLIFPNHVAIPTISITEVPLQGQHIQCLIGRDILQYGVFIYNGYDNSFTLSF